MKNIFRNLTYEYGRKIRSGIWSWLWVPAAPRASLHTERLRLLGSPRSRSWYQDLGTRILVPGSWYQDLGTILVPRSWYQNLDTKILVRRSWYQDPGTSNKILVPRCWYQDLGTKIYGEPERRSLSVCRGARGAAGPPPGGLGGWKPPSKNNFTDPEPGFWDQNLS